MRSNGFRTPGVPQQRNGPSLERVAGTPGPYRPSRATRRYRTLYVNGTRVAMGTATPFRHAIHLTGSYEQHAILGDCNSLVSTGEYQCTVYIDGAKVTRLTF